MKLKRLWPIRKTFLPSWLSGAVKIPLVVTFVTLVTLALLMGIAIFPHVVSAQEGGVGPDEVLGTNPKDRPVEVTVTVPVTNPPPVPVLVSPVNNAYLNQHLVTFEWRLLEHLLPYSKVELSVDGQTWLANLPLHSQETAEYRLTVVNNVFSVQLKTPKALSDGLHTWKVRAVDGQDRGTDSTTWSFSVDTQRPTILLTQIDQTTVAISSADVQTIPSEAVLVSGSNPKIIGKTEANLTVQLQLTWPNGTSKNYTVTSDSNGVFAFELPTFLAGDEMALRFSTVDKAGNATILEGVFLKYEPKKVSIVIPPGLFPDPLVIELPAFPPRLPWSTILPPEIAEEIEPITQPVVEATSVIEDWLEYLATLMRDTPQIMLGILVGLLSLYWLMLYWLTGNSWSGLGSFVGQWLKALILDWPAQPNRWCEDEQARPLPLLAFTVEAYHQETESVMRFHRWTNLRGEWGHKVEPQHLYGLELANRVFVYPSPKIKVSEVRTHNQTRQLYVTGENWYFVAEPEELQTKLQTSGEAFVVSSATPFNLVAWARRRRPPRWGGWRYVPRAVLFTAFLLAIGWLALAPSWWSWGLVGVFLVMGLRDVQWQVPKQWRGYTE